MLKDNSVGDLMKFTFHIVNIKLNRADEAFQEADRFTFHIVNIKRSLHFYFRI